MHPAAIVQSMLAAVAVRRRAALSLVRFMSLKEDLPTIGYVQDDSTTDDQRYDLYCVSHRLKLGSHGRRETHVANNDGGE